MGQAAVQSERVQFGKEIPRGNFDPNAEPDEQVLKADYFAFLSELQLVKLDLRAFRFDGFAAITRKCLAQHLDRIVAGKDPSGRGRYTREVLSATIPLGICGSIVGRYQVPGLSVRGELCTHLNLKVLEILTDEECQRVRKFSSTLNGNDVIEHIDELASLPGGISALMQFTAFSPAKTKLSDALER